MAADIDAQHLFFKSQFHLLGILAHIRQAHLIIHLVILGRNVKEGDLPRQIVLAVLLYTFYNLQINTQKLFTRAAQTVHGACLDKVLHNPLVHIPVCHAAGKIRQILVGSPGLSLCHHSCDQWSAHTFDGV